ncbi:MAG: hypothetical protein ACYTAF_12115, partial [Planctomycetota bacterium]
MGLALWYRSRRPVWKILIGAAVLLVVVAGLYVVARYFQYRASTIPAADFLPAGADILVEVPAFDATLERIRKTDAWKTIDKRLLVDKSVRGPINDAMKAAGLPTLDELEDRRYLEKQKIGDPGGLISRFMGRTASAAVDFSGGKTTFCAASRVSFGDYLLLPFLYLAPGFIGAEEVSVGGSPCLRRKDGDETIWIASHGPVVVLANGEKLMGAALRGGGRGPEWEGPFRARFDFTRSREMKDVRQDLALGPLGALLRDVDLADATSLSLQWNVEGSDIVVTTRWGGVADPGVRSPTHRAAYAPENCAGFIASTTSSA